MHHTIRQKFRYLKLAAHANNNNNDAKTLASSGVQVHFALAYAICSSCVYISKYIYIANSYNSYASDRTFTDNYCAYIHNHVVELAFSHYARASSHYA